MTLWLVINGLSILAHSVITYGAYPKFATYWMNILDSEGGPPQEDSKAYDEQWQESQS